MSDQVEDTSPEEEAPAPPPAMEQEVARNGVINLLDRDWAIGVDWYAYDLGVVSANIARFAGAHKPYLQRKQEQRNIGVGNPELGHGKMAVAAASLANWRPGSWLAVYPLGGGLYWLVAVLRNIIVEDTPALTEQEARNLYKEMTSPDWGWELVAADESWERGGLQLSEDALIAPNLESDLSSSLAVADPETLSQAIAWALIFRKYWYVPLPIIIVALIIYFDVPSRVVALFASAVDDVIITPTEVTLAPAYASEPRADVWLLNCARNLNPMAYFVPGWTLSRITCDSESDRIVYDYSREPAGVERQIEVVWDDITAQKEMQISPQDSFVVTDLGYANGGPMGVQPFYTAGDLSSLYFDLALILDQVPSLGGVISNPEDRDTEFGGAPDGGDLISITPATAYAPIVMTSEDSPKRWYETYGVAGMTINRVSYDGSTWTYEGKIYAKQ